MDELKKERVNIVDLIGESEMIETQILPHEFMTRNARFLR